MNLNTFEPDLDIARNLKVIEWLKTELVGAVADLLRGAVRGSEEATLDALSKIIIAAYVLGRRWGVPYSRLEYRVESQVRLNAAEGHEVEKWYGDLSALMTHLTARKGDR